ncbi:MAG: hypothetical protein WD336_05565 [Trueperaceae bacterium]
MHTLTTLVLLGFVMVIALGVAVWFTLLAFRTPPEPDPEMEAPPRPARPNVSNDAVRGAKAPRKHAPVDAFPAPPAASRPASPYTHGAADRGAEPWRARASDRGARAVEVEAPPTWRARTRERAEAGPDRPSHTDGRASRWSLPSGAAAPTRTSSPPPHRVERDPGDRSEPNEASGGGVRVRDRSDEDRRRNEEAFERFLDPKRRDEF